MQVLEFQEIFLPLLRHARSVLLILSIFTFSCLSSSIFLQGPQSLTLFLLLEKRGLLRCKESSCVQRKLGLFKIDFPDIFRNLFLAFLRAHLFTLNLDFCAVEFFIVFSVSLSFFHVFNLCFNVFLQVVAFNHLPGVTVALDSSQGNFALIFCKSAVLAHSVETYDISYFFRLERCQLNLVKDFLLGCEGLTSGLGLFLLLFLGFFPGLDVFVSLLLPLEDTQHVRQTGVKGID